MLWKTKQQVVFTVSAKTSASKAKLPLPAANGWIHGRASQKDHDRGQACANQFHGDLHECSWKRVPKSWQPPEPWSLDARPVSGFPAGGATGGSARRIMQTIPGCQGQVCWRLLQRAINSSCTEIQQGRTMAASAGQPYDPPTGPGGQEVFVLRTSTTPHTRCQPGQAPSNSRPLHHSITADVQKVQQPSSTRTSNRGTVSSCQASHRYMQRTSRCYGQRS